MSIVNVPDTDSFDLWRQKTNLLSLAQGDLERLIIPMSYPINGIVSSIGQDLVGVGTTFLSDLNVGTIVEDIETGLRRKIIEITSNTTAKTDIAFTPVLASAQLSTVDLVTALNMSYILGLNDHRNTLIRAIAMS